MADNLVSAGGTPPRVFKRLKQGYPLQIKRTIKKNLTDFTSNSCIPWCTCTVEGVYSVVTSAFVLTRERITLDDLWSKSLINIWLNLWQLYFTVISREPG